MNLGSGNTGVRVRSLLQLFLALDQSSRQAFVCMQVIAQLCLAMDAITSRQVFDTLAQMLDFSSNFVKHQGRQHWMSVLTLMMSDACARRVM